MPKKILVIDDEKSILDSLKGALSDEGYEVKTALSGKEGIHLLKTFLPDLTLLDIWMPEMDGLDVLKKIKSIHQDHEIIMMSGHGTIETAVKSTKLGAFDFIEKPLSLEKLLVMIYNALKSKALKSENSELRNKVDQTSELITVSPLMKNIKTLITQVAPTSGSVLITGENGTGKEVVARNIHIHSKRSNQPFIEVNCAAIPEELIESELFGHEKGAFTGATQMRRGKFDLADEGTLFLDEIGDMSLKTQAKVLRILQEQTFERVGGSQTHSVNVRIVAATNKDLISEIEKGNFRADLFYRLNVIPFKIPPLKNRIEDIPALTQHFVEKYCEQNGKPIRTITKEAMECLLLHDWPGNVRELKNLVERMLILTTPDQEGKPITEETIKPLLGDTTNSSTHPFEFSSSLKLKDARQNFEKQFIIQKLKENNGNISKTAQSLGIERSYLHRKLKAYGIETH